jgi:hypothetical protein
MPARQAVRIESFEEELCVAASRADEIAEARERDLARQPALRDEDVLRHLERIGPDRVAVAQPDESAVRLEEARELVVLDLRRAGACTRELRLERLRLVLAPIEPRDGSGEIELRAATLERQAGKDLV